MSFSTNSDLLSTNLIILFRLVKSLPIQTKKSPKRDLAGYTPCIKMTEYVDFALSDLVDLASLLFLMFFFNGHFNQKLMTWKTEMK